MRDSPARGTQNCMVVVQFETLEALSDHILVAESPGRSLLAYGGRVESGDNLKDVQLQIRVEDMGGVWANHAVVRHSPYEFTIDFSRIEFESEPPHGVVVSRVNLSPLFVRQLMDALQENWNQYAEKAMPPEVRDAGSH